MRPDETPLVLVDHRQERVEWTSSAYKRLFPAAPQLHAPIPHIAPNLTALYQPDEERENVTHHLRNYYAYLHCLDPQARKMARGRMSYALQQTHLPWPAAAQAIQPLKFNPKGQLVYDLHVWEPVDMSSTPHYEFWVEPVSMMA